jgi:hypothetical protein
VPVPIGCTQGFLVRRLVPGKPAEPARGDSALAARVADYLTHLGRAHRTSAGVSSEALCDMVDLNVSEGLGVEATAMLARHRRTHGAPETEQPVAIDGRMLLHEWIEHAGTYLKVDALDHHDDHFLPGPCDIAWDLAGACVELVAGRADAERLIRQYRKASGDRTILARLPAYLVAYLAYRLGYATMAAETLGTTWDGLAFRRLARRYARRLRRELAA